MRTVEDYETIRRAYFIEKLSIRAIRRKLGYDRETIRKAIVHAAPMPYTLERPREAPVIGPYKQRIAELSDEALATIDIADQLDSIHRCLNRFEARCLSIQVTAYDNEFSEPFIDEETCGELVFPNHKWEDVRKDARRANKLANQLTLTLTKIRTGMGGLQSQSPVPEDTV